MVRDWGLARRQTVKLQSSEEGPQEGKGAHEFIVRHTNIRDKQTKHSPVARQMPPKALCTGTHGGAQVLSGLSFFFFHTALRNLAPRGLVTTGVHTADK